MQEKTLESIWFGWRCGWHSWRYVHPKEPHQRPFGSRLSRKQRGESEREGSLQRERERGREWAREHSDCCTCFSSSWRPRLLPSKAITMSGKSVSKVGKSIDWDYLQKVVVSDGGKRELAALRRAYDDVAATINDKFNIVSVTSRQIRCSSPDLRSRSVDLAIS